ncbi:MAG: LPXTG cell wall anchor domain-containing protein [Actinomycetota bacterium]
MKKIVMCLVLASIAALLSAAPAFAQARDPFDPLVTQSSGSSAGGGGGSETGDTTPQGDVAPAAEDALPATGADTSVWLGLAYVLVALGAGALVLSKVYAPQRN